MVESKLNNLFDATKYKLGGIISLVSNSHLVVMAVKYFFRIGGW